MATSTLPTTPVKPAGVQPGGGFCVGLEEAWARARRAWLRTFRPAHVRAMQAKRQGHCPGCPHDVIDPRDLKYVRNVCGYWFRPEDDPYRYRDHLGVTRYGMAEVLLLTVLYLLLGGICAAGAVREPILWLVFVPLTVAYLWSLYFFRDPDRAIPADPAAVISPADGVVTNVEEVEEPDFPGGRALRISIFLSIFNVHVNRTPRAAEVVDVRYFPGAFLDARDPQSAVRNEQLWVDLIEPTGRPVRVKQISGAIARRIVCWLKPGDRLAAGDRFGMIKFGSRTDVLLPAADAKEIRVRVGDLVHGGTTVLLRVAP